MKNTQLMEKEEISLLREEFLKPEELFLLKFMNSFNRTRNREWTEQGLWMPLAGSYNQ